MRIMLYEFITGGGLWELGDAPAECALLSEATAMVSSLAMDLADCPHVELFALRDSRLRKSPFGPIHHVIDIRTADENRQQLRTCATELDAVMLIAPDDKLAELVQVVEAAGGQLISPHAEFVSLAADKLRTNQFLRSKRIPVPLARGISPGDSLPDRFPYPAVLKPRYGAGSVGVQAVFRRSQQMALSSQEWCLEKFHTGLASSVSIISGPAGNLILPPCRQRVSDDGCFRYLGGVTPLAQQLADRARRLAKQVARALPQTSGYFGVDLVLGSAPDGSQDVVIEVNPRLTTSYVGLRELAHSNLAAAMLAVTAGKDYELSFSQEPIEFSVS